MRKLRTDGEMLDVEARLETLRERLHEVPGLIAVYLFGSYGTRFQTPLSDIDLALVFRPGAAPELDDELELRADVLDALNEDDVSIVILNRAPSLFQFEVLETGRVLLCSDETALADFVAGVLLRHSDYVIDHRRFLHDYDAALRARYAS